MLVSLANSIPKDVDFKVIDEKPRETYFVLPLPFAGVKDLSEAELNHIAAAQGPSCCMQTKLRGCVIGYPALGEVL